MILTAATTRRLSRRAGFTLLEVLVVVAILVILSTVAVVATTRYLEDARKSRAQLQCKSLASACEAYYLNSQSGNNYPQQLTDLLDSQLFSIQSGLQQCCLRSCTPELLTPSQPTLGALVISLRNELRDRKVEAPPGASQRPETENTSADQYEPTSSTKLAG